MTARNPTPNTNRPARSTSWRSSSVVFVLLLVLRLINALSVQTYFQPDEYFQSLEPAWQIAFGTESGAWITWEWREHLRSSIHPMLFAAVYRTAAQLSSFIGVSPNTRAEILLAAPKVLQAMMAATGDLFTWMLARKLYGSMDNTSFATLALTAFSPWQFHCSVRTFSNSLETTLTVIALYYWPWSCFLRQQQIAVDQPRQVAPQNKADPDAKNMVQQFKNFLEQDGSTPENGTATGTKGQTASASSASSPGGLYASLTAAAVACILRPTNVIIWVAVSMCLLNRHDDSPKTMILASNALLCGTSVLAASLGMDRAYYGQWVFPPLKFLYLNVVQAVAGFYGRNRVDYYFTEGLPLLLTTALPFAAIGMHQSLRPGMDRPTFKGYVERQSRFVLATAVLVTVLAMTMISHKEVRFIYPLLPILHVLAAKPLATFFDSVPANKVRLGLLVFMLTINVYIAAYVTFVHQRGVVDAIHYLRHEQEARLPQSFTHRNAATKHGSNVTVGFLMPCHSTPWRSHLVYPEINAWALTCEPPLDMTVEERRHYEDEADIFYAHPAAWIDENMKDRRLITTKKPIDAAARPRDEARRQWPEYLVFFQHLEPVMSAVLERSKYEECWRGFNTHWHDDWRRRGDVLVWCMRR